MGDEVGHLEQVVAVGARLGRRSLSLGDVLRMLHVLPRLVPAGHEVAAPEPAVEAGRLRGIGTTRHFLN